MGSMDDWKEKAVEYYRDGLSYTDIEALLDVSRKSISSYIKSLPGYGQIQTERKKISAAKRRVYKTEKQRQSTINQIYKISLHKSSPTKDNRKYQHKEENYHHPR